MEDPKPHFEPSIKERIVGLDELRGIALLLVIIDHGFLIFSKQIPQFLVRCGAVGVDMFFIISGYLIAHILINAAKKQNYFRKFYVRRIFRIWPLYFLVIALITGVNVARGAGEIVNMLPLYVVFFQNFIVPFQLGKAISGLDHLWSLAIEEQFYLILPFLFYFITPKRWHVVVFYICLLSLLGRFLFFKTEHVPLDFYYTNIKQTYFRIHILGLGVLMAIPNPKKYLILFFSVWLILLVFLFKGNGLLEMPIILLIAITVWFCIHKKPLIRSASLSHIGKLCFGLYVLHFPLVRFMGAVTVNKTLPVQIIAFLIYLAITYILARLSFTYFEIPIQNKRTKYER